ncbi:hypothetical protein ACHAQH_008663, partial [Verticillium albo-atrum]
MVFSGTGLWLRQTQAITNSTTVPDTYMFTRTTEEQAAALERKQFIGMIFSGLGVVCFISMLPLVFHIVGMIADERESGMAQLIDVMGGGAASARAIMGGFFSSLFFPTSNAGIPILWKVLTGWALTSACVFGATFAVRYSAIYAVVA